MSVEASHCRRTDARHAFLAQKRAVIIYQVFPHWPVSTYILFLTKHQGHTRSFIV